MREDDASFAEFQRTVAPFKDRLEGICKAFGTVLPLAFSRSREAPISAARSACWSFMFDELGFSMVSIARLWGRDHTTVMHGVDTHHAREGTDRGNAKFSTIVCPYCQKASRVRVEVSVLAPETSGVVPADRPVLASRNAEAEAADRGRDTDHRRG